MKNWKCFMLHASCFMLMAAAVAGRCALLAADVTGQTNEAEAVFTGKANANERGGAWKVVCGEPSGPELKAIEVLTQYLTPILLREGHLSTFPVLPVEYPGGARVEGKRHAVLLGVPSKNRALARYVKPSEVPEGGYLIRTLHEQGGHNLAIIAGSNPSAVLWGMFEFLDVTVPELTSRIAPGEAQRYHGEFFRAAKVPTFSRATAPETKVRSVFSWGQVIDNYERTFRELARMRFNRVLLWNDQRVLNAREVVESAHSWGIEVYWGFSWGWTLSGSREAKIDFDRLIDGIVDEWRRIWKPMGGDGIYFQSFTETSLKTIGGRPIPETAVELVNQVTKRIRAEEPNKAIVFGLHSNSMRLPGAMAALRKVDPTVEILWENCTITLPYWESHGRDFPPDYSFCDRVLANNAKIGFAWKSQLRMDWKHYVKPAGPFVLGCAGEAAYRRDREVVEALFGGYDEDWLVNGVKAWEHIRHLRSQKKPPEEFNAVVETHPPYAFATWCQAELFWNSSDSWEEVQRRVRQRLRSQK